MPLMVIPNEGKLLWLDQALSLNGAGGENFLLALYQNNYTPVDASTIGSFTQATFPGYADVPLTRASFGTSALVGNIAYSTYPSVPTYTCSGGGGQIVYGWVMYGASSNKVYAAGLLSASRNMVTGAVLTLNPFRIGQETFV